MSVHEINFRTRTKRRRCDPSVSTKAKMSQISESWYFDNKRDRGSYEGDSGSETTSLASEGPDYSNIEESHRVTA